MELSAHELLRVRDCLEYGCTNDAGPDGVCSDHVMYRNARSAELAARAVDLRARGTSQRAIAEQLGVSVSYASGLYRDPTGSADRARKDGYRRPCPKCGTLMSGHDGPSSPKAPRQCRHCQAAELHADRLWRRDRVVSAIRAFARITGRPPLSSEWLYTYERAALPDPPSVFPSWPWTVQVLTAMGSWANAIEAAGFDRPYRGRKVRPMSPRGTRRTGMPMKNEYVVFRNDGEGLREVGRAEATDQVHALEAVVGNPNGAGGEFYVVSAKTVGAPFRVETRPVFARVKDAAP